MSVDLHIYCDGSSCSRNGVPKARDYKTQEEREQLMGSGWMSDSGEHFCPECINRHLKEIKKGRT